MVHWRTLYGYFNMAPYLTHARLCDYIDGKSETTARSPPMYALMFSISLVGVLSRVHVK